MSEENDVVVEVPAASEPAQNNVESATTEPVAEEAQAAEDQPKEAPKPGKNSFDRKIDRLYKSAAEQKARADYLEKQLEELKPRQTTPTGEPRIEDFSDIDEFVTAKAEFLAENKLRLAQQAKQQETSRASQQKLVSGWEEKAGRAYDKYDDFDEVVGDIKPINGMTVAIMQADNAEDVAYYLGKNLKEAHRIASLDPIAQVREIGRLELKLANEPLKVKTPSQAPAPINPLTGKSAASNGEPLDTDDYKTWLKKRNKQLGR